jgi:hypothetical protein
LCYIRPFFLELQQIGKIPAKLEHLRSVLSLATSFNLQHLPTIVQHALRLEKTEEMIAFLNATLAHLYKNTILFKNEIEMHSNELNTLKSHQITQSEVEAFMIKFNPFLQTVANSVKINSPNQ